LNASSDPKASLIRAFELARHAGAAGRHHLPELGVVPVLAGIVEDAVLGDGAGLIGAGHDLLDRFAFPFGPGDQLVAVVDIGLVVDVVVVFQRLLAHAMGGQRVMGIGQIGQFESHRGPPRVGCGSAVRKGSDARRQPPVGPGAVQLGMTAPLLKPRSAPIHAESDREG
jgi:hypothetical protein